MHPRSRDGIRPSCSCCPPRRGSRECRVFWPHPQPCVRNKKAHKQVTTGIAGAPAFPARWSYDLFRALSGDRAFLSPSPARCASIVANLTPASRRQDHAASSSARQAHSSCAQSRGHRIPCPTSVTIAKRPSWRARDGRINAFDLPDVTSEMACDTMARRANHSRCAKSCQGRSNCFILVIASDSEAIQSGEGKILDCFVALLLAMTLTPSFRTTRSGDPESRDSGFASPMRPGITTSPHH
jgi:hypothetical protein